MDFIAHSQVVQGVGGKTQLIIQDVVRMKLICLAYLIFLRGILPDVKWNAVLFKIHIVMVRID